LMRIEEYLEKSATYAGRNAFVRRRPLGAAIPAHDAA
jgi:hypothetical protein